MRWGIGLAVAAMAGLAAAVCGATSGRAEDTVRIGIALELSGRFVSFGAYCRDGIEFAGGRWGPTVAGKKIEFVTRDLQSDAQATVAAFTELVSTAKINYIIGPTASPIAAAAIGPWRQTKPIWLVPGASTTTLEKEIGAEPTFFHPYPFAYHYHETLSRAMSHYLGRGRKLAIIYVDDAYGRTHLPLVKDYFTKAGFEIVAEEIMRANSPDLNPLLMKIRSSRPDVLIGLVQSTDAVTLAKQVYTRNLKIPYLIGAASTQHQEWQEAVGEAQEGWIGLGTYLPKLVDWPANPEFPKVFMSTAEWERLFEARYKRIPTYNDIMCYTNAIQLLISIDRAGGDDKDKMSKELAALDVMSPFGRTKFSPTPGGTRNQAFADMIVFQRHNNGNVLLYPLAMAKDAKLLQAPR